MKVLGIDPGAKYTGVSLRDLAEETILISSTYVKPETLDIYEWARTLPALINEDILQHHQVEIIGVEGISAPKGYQNGRRSPLNPKHIISTAILVGAFLLEYRTAVVVPPGKNGSTGVYPDVLNGRRPKTLPGSSAGATTRNHEKSAYDVAGEAFFITQQQ